MKLFLSALGGGGGSGLGPRASEKGNAPSLLLHNTGTRIAVGRRVLVAMACLPAATSAKRSAASAGGVEVELSLDAVESNLSDAVDLALADDLVAAVVFFLS